MQNLQKLVFKATIEPEKFKFYKLIKGPDDCIRYVALHAPNEQLTKKTIFVADAGVVEYESVKTTKIAYFENWERIQKEVVEAGFEPIYLKQFATEIFAISEFLDEETEL